MERFAVAVEGVGERVQSQECTMHQNAPCTRMLHAPAACLVRAWLLLPTCLPAAACPTHSRPFTLLLALCLPGCYCPPSYLLLPAPPHRGRHVAVCLVPAWLLLPTCQPAAACPTLLRLSRCLPCPRLAATAHLPFCCCLPCPPEAVMRLLALCLPGLQVHVNHDTQMTWLLDGPAASQIQQMSTGESGMHACMHACMHAGRGTATTAPGGG